MHIFYSKLYRQIGNISDKIRSWYYQLNHKSRHTIQWLARHLIIQHDIFLHMTHFLHISLSAVTCFIYMCRARENIRIFQDIVFQISAVAFATFNIWYLRSFEKTCKKRRNRFFYHVYPHNISLSWYVLRYGNCICVF